VDYGLSSAHLLPEGASDTGKFGPHEGCVEESSHRQARSTGRWPSGSAGHEDAGARNPRHAGRTNRPYPSNLDVACRRSAYGWAPRHVLQARSALRQPSDFFPLGKWNGVLLRPLSQTHRLLCRTVGALGSEANHNAKKRGGTTRSRLWPKVTVTST